VKPDRAYAAHERIVGPNRRHAALWRLLAGLGLIAVVAFGLNSALHAALLALDPAYWANEFATPNGQGNAPLPMLVLLASFASITIGVLVAAQLVQKRPPLGVIGSIPLAVKQFWRVFRLLLGISVVIFLLPPYDMGEPLVPNLPAGTWLALLPLSLSAILIQTSSEEILFRGYIQQALAARFSSPLVWMVLPSALFALGHYVPAESGENAWIIAVWAGLFGLLMADLTARAGTLGPAIAVHMVNNLTALLIVSFPDSLNGLSLFTLPYSMADTEGLRGWMAVDFAMMLIGWLAARLAIRR
jgi:membrane protease YdiL (CAAX protease family)